MDISMAQIHINGAFSDVNDSEKRDGDTKSAEGREGQDNAERVKDIDDDNSVNGPSIANGDTTKASVEEGSQSTDVTVVNEVEVENLTDKYLIYGINDAPPIHVTIVCAIQVSLLFYLALYAFDLILVSLLSFFNLNNIFPFNA